MARRKGVQSRDERGAQDQLIAVSKTRARPPDQMLEDLDGARNAQLREEPAHADICELIALRPPGANPLNKPCHRKSHRCELISLAPPTYERSEERRVGKEGR